MTARARLALAVALAATGALGNATPARAQDDDLPPPLFDEEPGSPGGESGDEVDDDQTPATGDEEAIDEEANDDEEPTSVEEWVAPKILVVAEARTPRAIVREVSDLLAAVGEVESGDELVREARSRGLPPMSDAAFEALLPGAGMGLVVTLETVDRERVRVLRIAYREGHFGLTLLEEEHPLAGDRLRTEAHERIVAEARLALAATTRPTAAAGSESSTTAGLGPDAPREHAADAEPGAAIHVALGAGAGIAMRRFELPVALGIVRLSTNPFPAASIRLALDLEPHARGPLSLGAELAYLTSVGLTSTDMRVDGTSRETPSRSQRFDVWLSGAYRLGEPLDAPSLGAAVGFGLRSFESEAPVTLPDYALSGFSLQLRFALPLFDGRFLVAVAPELGWIAFVDGSLTEQGVSSSAVALGIEARARLGIAGPFYAELSFRESHAILSSTGGESNDVERYLTLGVLYRP